MRTPRFVLGSLGTVAAAAALVTLAMAPAMAAGPYVVKAGTKTTGNTTFTAATTGASPQIVFTTSGGLELGCDSGTANGIVRLGNSAAGTGIAFITGSTWTNCVGPLGLSLNVAQAGTWRIDGTGPVNANSALPGKIVAITANVTSNPAGQCSFTVKGQVNGSLAQKPATAQKLRVGTPAPSNLTISNVNGCFGAIANGQKATFAAVYAITTAAGPLSITNAP